MKPRRREDEIVRRTVSKADRFRQLGKNVKRPEGVSKVTGRAVYADDFKTEGHLYGKTIRSEVAHALIKKIHFEPGVPWDEFVVVTAEDIPGQNAVTLVELDQPFLCEREIMHKAEPVALIAHPDKELVEKAVRHVSIEAEPLPAIFEIEQAERGEVVLQDDNLVKEYRVGLDEVPQSAWDACDFVCEQTYRTGAAEQLYIEPHAMVSQVEFTPEGEIERVNLWGTLQCPFYVVKAVAPLFGISHDRVRVVQTETGGGFGGKEEYPNMLGGHAALLSWKAGGTPVRMVYDRQEDLWATTKRHPSRTTVKAGFKADGTLHALAIDFHLNAGAYKTLSAIVLSRGVLHSWGPYRCAHTSARARAWLTNSNPFGAYRGFGAPQSIFALELHLNRCAHEMGIDPAELRRKNLYRPEDLMPTGQLIRERIDLDMLLERALEKSDYPDKRMAFAQFNREQEARGGLKRRGIGLSLYFHGSGFTGKGEVVLASRLGLALDSNGHVDIRAGQVEYGQGTITTFVQIASEALNVPPEWITKAQPDTAAVPDSGPTVASRTTMVVGGLVKRACERLLETLRTEAGLPAEHAPGDFQAAARRYAQAHDEPLYVEVGFQQPETMQWDEENYRGSAYSAYAWKCDVVAVELDLTTYAARCTDFVSVVEAGRILNPILAAGQIEGGNAQALGYALYEDTVLEEGAMANCQYTNYIIPTSADTPDMDVEFVEFPYENYGPYAAKGIGELPIDGPAPALAAAVAHALGGRFINEIPLLPERIFEHLEADRAPVA